MSRLDPTQLARLREQAEKLNRAASHTLPKLTPQNVETLVHELRVHQVELELQCQELQLAHREVEESRDRYRDLYESIPIGYLTSDVAGRIYDINPAGASLLGLRFESHKLNSFFFFFFFFSTDEADEVLLLFRKVLAEQKPDGIDLKMKRLDESAFVAAIHAAPVLCGEGKGERLRIAFR